MYDAQSKLSRQDLLVHTCLLMLPKSWHYSVLPDTHTHTHALFLARARSLSPSLPPPPPLSLTYTHSHTHKYARVCSRIRAYARVCSRMLAYASVCSRMVAYGRVVADWRCEARHGSVSLSDYRLLQYISPPLHSYRFLDITYRLRHTGIASFISATPH